MKLLVITFFLFISSLYSQGADSLRAVKLGRIDSNYVLYSSDANHSLFFSKSIMDSLNFGKLKDIYEDAATTYSPELKKNQSKSWFETHPLLINLLIILLIAIIT